MKKIFKITGFVLLAVIVVGIIDGPHKSNF